MVLKLEVILEETDNCNKKYDSRLKSRCHYAQECFNLKRKYRKPHTYRNNMNRRRRRFSRKLRINIFNEK